MNKDVSINGNQVFVKSGSDYQPLTTQALTQWLTSHPEVITDLNIPGVTFDKSLAQSSGRST